MDTAEVSLDKWLWAARFFKTRTIASDSIAAGHVSLNGQRPKPSRALKLGDMLSIRTPAGLYVVRVKGLSERRGPTAEAQKLYAETPESVAARELARMQKSLDPVFDHPAAKGRPTKKWRRQLHVFTRQHGER